MYQVTLITRSGQESTLYAVFATREAAEAEIAAHVAGDYGLRIHVAGRVTRV